MFDEILTTSLKPQCGHKIVERRAFHPNFHPTATSGDATMFDEIMVSLTGDPSSTVASVTKVEEIHNI